MPLRPNLYRKQGLSPPLPQKTSWFQRARDWTAFVVSLASLLTASIALRNTLTGPQPFLSQLAGDPITLLRSDQFIVNATGKVAIVLRDETGKPDDFPLLDLQVTLANRAAPPNGIGIRAIEGDLVFSRQGKSLFRSPYVWYRTGESSITPDQATKTDRVVFDNVAQVAPFDLPGGGTWSREVVLMPQQTWAAVAWPSLDDEIAKNCPEPRLCQGELTLRVRLDNGASLTERCNFPIDEHLLAHLRGIERHFFTTPRCYSPTALQQQGP